MLLTIMETCIPQKGVNAESTKWLGSHRPKKCMCVYIYIYTYVVLKVDVNWVKNQYSYHMLGNIYIYIHINMCIYIYMHSVLEHRMVYRCLCTYTLKY